jgi:hypothetical protein
MDFNVFDIGDFTEMFRHTPILVEIRQQWRWFYMTTYMRFRRLLISAERLLFRGKVTPAGEFHVYYEGQISDYGERAIILSYAYIS